MSHLLTTLALIFSLSSVEQLKVAHAYLIRGEPAKAVKLLDETLEADKTLKSKQKADGLETLGIAHLQLKDGQKAAQALEKSVALAPGNEKRWLLLAMAYDLASKPALIHDTYQRALSQLPKSPELHRAYGMLKLEDEDIPVALKHLNKSVKLSLRSPDFLMDLAYVQLRVGAYAKARDLALEALSKGPDMVDLYQILGDANAALESFKPAERAYLKAIQLSPTYFQAHYHLALLYQANEKLSESKNAFQKARQIQPDHLKTKALLGVILARLGDDKEAMPLLEEALKVDPNFKKGRAALIKIYERANLMQKANALRK